MIVVTLVVLAAASAAPLASSRVRGAVRTWVAVSLTLLWLSLAFTWLIIFPGARWAGITFLVLFAGAISLIAVLATALRRVRHRRLDAIGALTLLSAVTVLLVMVGGRLMDAGIQLRLGHVRDRYEEAILRGTVEQSGGFVDGELAGWVWADKLILDPLSGVIFDPADRLDDEQRFIGALGELADRERIRNNWFHCVYS